MPGQDATVSKPLRLGLDDVETTTGWVLADSAVVAAYGAPLAVRSGQLLDFYVPDQATVRRAIVFLRSAPVFVALDLAQDAGRGREARDAWTPPERWARVW
jgi:hypothetical protein